MKRFLIYMLRIRRVEFRIAEIPILAIPLLILLRDTAPLKTFYLWEGVFIFFLLFAFGDMINCLADRDLDAVYKPHLSEAVYGLGVGFVKFQVIATAALDISFEAEISSRSIVTTPFSRVSDCHSKSARVVVPGVTRTVCGAKFAPV